MGVDERERFELLLIRKRLSERTKKEYLWYYDKLQIILLETKLPFEQLTVDAFLDLNNNRVARAFLKSYFEFLHNKELEIVKPTGREEVKEQVTIPEKDMEKIREGLYEYEDRYGLIFDITETCALRRQEILNLKAQDIEIINDADMFLLIRKGKGKKERKVFVKDEVAEKVLKYLGEHHLKTEQFLFESKIVAGQPINSATWNKVFSAIAFAVTGKKYHPHQLRGTRATRWYEQGIDIARIQQRLGHSNISTTMLYIKPDARKEMERWSKEG